jgi:hypothetical protein
MKIIFTYENCIMMNFTVRILHRILLLVIKSRRMRWAGHVHAWGRGGLKGRDHWEDLGVDERITLRWTLVR